MNTVVETLKAQLIGLPGHDRAELASFLLSSLDESCNEDPGVVRAAWRDEIEKRVDELDSGQVQGIPAELVFDEIRKKLA